MRLALDHLVIVAGTLAEGVAWVQDRLGVTVPPGGAHPAMGTHNALMRLGAGVYLEVIAVDPAAPAPDGPRWFGLDTRPAQPHLAAWVARVDQLDAALARLPDWAGQARPMARGALTWRIALRCDGALPMRGAFPLLIGWPDGRGPSDGLPDLGCRLARLRIRHPDADRLSGLLAGVGLEMAQIAIEPATAPGLAAWIETPSGQQTL